MINFESSITGNSQILSAYLKKVLSPLKHHAKNAHSKKAEIFNTNG